MRDSLNKLIDLIDSSDAIIIGAGAGLSTSAGFEYGGATFMKHFKYMFHLYGYTDMYSAGFHNFDTSEDFWGYWSKFIYLNRYQGVKSLYNKLYKLIRDKNYFVLTTNVDHQFQLAGFDKKRLFYTQGDYGLIQCSIPCHHTTYDNEEIIMKMVEQQKNGKIPSSLIPICPRCGKEMTTNLRIDEKFVEDEGWNEHAKLYNDFLNENKFKKVLYLELGVGFNTPGIIKYPFWRFVNENKNATYAIINPDCKYIPKEIIHQTIKIESDIDLVISKLLDLSNKK